MRPFMRFVAVGAVGFMIDAGVLTALVLGAHWATFPARIVSITLAITITWLINRYVTFKHRTVPLHVEYAGYFGIQLAGVVLNLAIFVICLKIWPQLARWPVIAQGAGSAGALFFNFATMRKTLYAAPSDR
jgi:putative flippase GtrA